MENNCGIGIDFGEEGSGGKGVAMRNYFTNHRGLSLGRGKMMLAMDWDSISKFVRPALWPSEKP